MAGNFAAIATKRAMRERYRPGVLAYSPATGEEYSANPGDYWAQPDDWTMTDSEGEPMILVTRHTVYRDAEVVK